MKLGIDQRVLVVLDNAAGESRVLPLLPGTAGCAVIVTSRAPLPVLPGAHRLALDVLDADSCRRMLAAILDADRTSAERAQVERLAELCGRLPLALRIAADARAFALLGSAFGRQGDSERGERCPRHPLTVSGELGLVVQHAYTSRSLGDHLAARKQTTKARGLFEVGLEVTRAAGDRAGEAGFLRRLARVAVDDGEFDTALALASRAVDMARSGGGALYAHSLRALGDVHSARGVRRSPPSDPRRGVRPRARSGGPRNRAARCRRPVPPWSPNLSHQHITPDLDPSPWTGADILLTNYPDTPQPLRP